MSVKKCFGLYCFESPIVTGDSYKTLLTFVCRSSLLTLRTDKTFWQEDASKHYSLKDEKLPNLWIGRGGPTTWKTRSLDMTLLDFLMWA